jgi:hypothetical protein
MDDTARLLAVEVLLADFTETLHNDALETNLYIPARPAPGHPRRRARLPVRGRQSPQAVAPSGLPCPDPPGWHAPWPPRSPRG